MTDSCMVCPSCGHLVAQLHEGYCRECLEHRHDAHLRHIYEQQEWDRLSPAERDRRIRDAMRRG